MSNILIAIALIFVSIACILNSLAILNILKKDRLKIVGSATQTKELLDYRRVPPEKL